MVRRVRDLWLDAPMDEREGSGDRARNRQLWSAVNEQFTDADAAARWDEQAITWGLFRIPESDLGLLGDLAGALVAEIGAGTAYFSAWMARAGARPVALDLSGAQLDTARRCQQRTGLAFPLLEADGESLPLASDSFDLVVSEYGAGPWCDPARWLPEAARVLRPGGRLVFLTNSVLAGMCVPAEAGFAGEQLLRGQRDLYPIAWPEGGVEHHPGHGEWIRLLRGAGFAIDALHELYPPDDAPTHEFYDIVTADWARRWPAEDLWCARLA
jgi:SAM-dependent methyltransferase